MSGFKLDGRLQSDCHLLTEGDDRTCLLHRNAAVDWFILVPHVQEIEFYSLSARMQVSMCEEINRLSAFIRSRAQVDKINIGMLGNVVSQLHIHVIGRRRDDPYWPDPVWGKPEVVAQRDDQSVADIRRQWHEFCS